MPDKPLTIATYAAGAGLAAITLVYVFAPTFFLDDEANTATKSSRKKGIVGLHNPANDCFINSVLQTLAGLPELRTYLIRELHRRNLDGKEIYSLVERDDDTIRPNEGKDIVERKEVKEPEWKILGLQQGLVTAGLKQILDALNERPIVKKTISASGFVHVLEQAFRTRISRQQQDAQEFLQVVTERLSEEYYAGRSARKKARSMKSRSQTTLRNESDAEHDSDGAIKGLDESEDTIRPTQPPSSSTTTLPADVEAIRSSARTIPGISEPPDAEEDPSFPFEGKIESQIECTFCHFKPAPTTSSFVTLTLPVPQTSASTSLSSCFDGMLKIEHIDDFKCEYCRLAHALDCKRKDLLRSTLTPAQKSTLENDIQRLTHALATDPEKPPPDIPLPPVSASPKRKITRHMRISLFPRVLAIHLSRSVWDTQISSSSSSSKNLAKVAFPETLPLGGLLDRVDYRLLGVVTHKGGHNSGHYESFRRQILAEPVSAKVSMGREGVFSARASPSVSGLNSPALTPRMVGGGVAGSRRSAALRHHGASSSTPSSTMESARSAPSPHIRISDAPAASYASFTSSPSSSQTRADEATEAEAAEAEEEEADQEDQPPRSRSVSEYVADTKKSLEQARQRRRIRRENSRWWRISDDKVKESSTRDVLGMQREVYLLFYEIGSGGTVGGV